jgi:uncharacterized membrane protein
VNKEEFLKTLEASLKTFTLEEKKDILYDYEEHFRIGLQNGKTEEELIKELGSPNDIAKQYKSNIDSPSYTENIGEPLKYEQVKLDERSIVPSIISALALGFFNLIFVIWIFIAAGATLFGLAAAAIALTTAGIVVTLGPILVHLFPSNVFIPSNIPYDLTILFGIGTAALGALFCIGIFYLVKYFYFAAVKYIKWNIAIIRK